MHQSIFHVLKWAVPVLLTLGWAALPARRTRARFVALLLAVFVAGGVAGIVGSSLARVLAAYIMIEMSHDDISTCADKAQ
jgi:hypothetical protein